MNGATVNTTTLRPSPLAASAKRLTPKEFAIVTGGCSAAKTPETVALQQPPLTKGGKRGGFERVPQRRGRSRCAESRSASADNRLDNHHPQRHQPRQNRALIGAHQPRTLAITDHAFPAHCQMLDIGPGFAISPAFWVSDPCSEVASLDWRGSTLRSRRQSRNS